MARLTHTHVDDPQAVGRRLKAARERAGLSQRALAFPGCSPAYISLIEAGERVPSLQLLRELGRRLGVSEDYLATGTEASTAGERDPRLVDAEVAFRLDDVELARALYGEALAEAPDDAARGAALEGLGQVAYRSGQPREAIALLEEAFELLSADPCERPAAVEALGRAYAGIGELGPAIALFENCRDRFARDGDLVNEVRFTSLLGYALTDNGNFAEAERVLADALNAGKEITDPLTRARLYWSQSRLRGELGQTELAAQYAQEALELLRRTEHTYFLAATHELLASLYNDLGRSEEALALLREGWPMLVENATPVQIAHYQIEEARALAGLAEREAAAKLAMDISGRLSDAQPADAGRAYIVLAEVFDHLEERARARELYELGIEILEAQGPSRYLVQAYRSLAAILEADDRKEEALAVLKRALAVQERAGRPLG